MAGDLSAGAAYVHKAVLSPQPSLAKARRFYPALRDLAQTGRALKGHTFTVEEVEEAIAAFERTAALDSAPPQLQEPDGAEARKTPPELAVWWPKWVLDKTTGVEVKKGTPSAWFHAVPVSLGRKGRKPKYLFVQGSNFQMDCKQNEVRPPGGGPTVQQQLEELLARGDDPRRHPEWTTGKEVVEDMQVELLTPGIDVAGDDSQEGAAEGLTDFLTELEGEFERMTMLRKSALVKIPCPEHPDPLSEPRAAASIQLPALTERDTVALPLVVAQERLSSLQLETVCFAARRFREKLPNGHAAGYMLGDGTGCGKGRVIAALMIHLWNCGHRRSVWISATNDLYHDAVRDLSDLGAKIHCAQLKRIPFGQRLDSEGTEAHKDMIRQLGVDGDGIIFLTYSLLVNTSARSKIYPLKLPDESAKKELLAILNENLLVFESKLIGDAPGQEGRLVNVGDRIVTPGTIEEVRALTPPCTVSVKRMGKGDQADGQDLTPFNSRLGQLVDWLGGSKATGLICYDEVHKAKNLCPDKEENASTKTGLFVDLLQNTCPNAPVLYVSATAATEVQHLGYMSRLGAWGKGTAFASFQDFADVIAKNGVSAMELFAMNMKAIGAQSCRSLAYVGTEFETHNCGLTKDQMEAYDASCRFWQHLVLVYRKFTNEEKLACSYAKRFPNRFGTKLKGMSEKEVVEKLAKSCWQFFWSAQQRFFKAMCNSMKVSAACSAAKEALDRNEQVVISIWGTGEARSQAAMAKMKEETPGHVVIEAIHDGALVEVEVKEKATLEGLKKLLLSTMKLKQKLILGGHSLPQGSKLLKVGGQPAKLPEELPLLAVNALEGPSGFVKLHFQLPLARRLAIEARMFPGDESVQFELTDDALGQSVIVAKVLDGPEQFHAAAFKEAEWQIKTINKRPVGKISLQKIKPRLRPGVHLTFQDPVIQDHLSGPKMILEHFVSTGLLTGMRNGEHLDWAVEEKTACIEMMQALKLPANALDEVVDNLGGGRKVAEMSGRSHRMVRRRDGTFAYVARCEELKCSSDQVNLMEQGHFQKGTKKVCVVTEVASAGISLHSDRRQVRSDFQPPRRTMISLELPWGADKAIQCFGRVHRANQLVPPKFIMLVTDLGGEMRFTSAIARRTKLLGAVTKGDRMTSMSGCADRHFCDFDVNNYYGRKALATLFTDTRSTGEPILQALYENRTALPFIGEADDGEATGRWPDWEAFANDVRQVWGRLCLVTELEELCEEMAEPERWMRLGAVRESNAINRFLNRILMLEVTFQNALFDVFFAIYTELVRIDRENGDYDDGVQDLNWRHGQKIQHIEVDHREVLYRDPISCAETHYVCLRLDLGISWEVVKAAYDSVPKHAGSIEGFYVFRQPNGEEPRYVFVKELQRLGGAGASGASWMARRRTRQFVLWQADAGVRSGLCSVISEAAFLMDHRFEHLDGSEDSLREAEEGWKRLYEQSVSSRMHFEHVLTGDVLGAWRLATGSAAKGMRSALKIVRAITQPSGEPVVGMRLLEDELVDLKYIFSCRQVSAQEELNAARGEQASINELALLVAEKLLSFLAEAKDRSLPLGSWIQVHKLLAEEGVPKSVDGLRAVQLAVDLLQKRKLIQNEGINISIPEDAKIPTGQKLESLLFPQNFELGSEDESGDDEDGEGEDSQDDEVSKPSKPRRKRDAEEFQDVATPAKAWKNRGKNAKATAEGEEDQPRSNKKGRGGKRRRTSVDSTDAPQGTTAPSLSEEEEEEEEAGTAEEEQDSPSPSTRKRRREVLARELFGESDEELVQGLDDLVEDQEEGNSSKKRREGETSSPSTSSWTYIVVNDKKIRILPLPNLAAAEAGEEYLKPGTQFEVSERQEGADGRLYLRLSDGRGWTYNRSAKDFKKVVVEEA